MGKKIVVTIPSYNNRQWYARNLASVFAQDYNEEFRAIYIDDGSSDGTWGRMHRTAPANWCKSI